MIYLLIAIGMSPGCSSTVHIYTQTITERHKTDIDQHNNGKTTQQCNIISYETYSHVYV